MNKAVRGKGEVGHGGGDVSCTYTTKKRHTHTAVRWRMCDARIGHLDTDGVQVPYQHISGTDSMVVKLVNVEEL